MGLSNLKFAAFLFLFFFFLFFRCRRVICNKTYPLLVVSLTVSNLHMLLICNDNI